MHTKTACVVAALSCCTAVSLAAQEAQPLRHVPAWGIWGGIARNSPGNIWGAETGRDVELLALRLTWPLTRSHRLALDYVVDAVPAARVSMVRDDPDPPSCSVAKPGEPCVNLPVISDPRPVFGLGAAPVGLQLRHRTRPHLQVHGGISAGILRFAREMPMDGAARVNFTAELGTGVLIGRPGRLGIALGYKFYHISNAWTATHNPGIDNHMLVIGLQRIPTF